MSSLHTRPNTQKLAFATDDALSAKGGSVRTPGRSTRRAVATRARQSADGPYTGRAAFFVNGKDGSSECADGLNALLQKGHHKVALCNPPFGTGLLETRPAVLKKFVLARVSADPDGQLLDRQEIGLLFVEWCLSAVHPGGRVGLIVPNGYLGNRGARYVDFRRWLLSEARVAAVVGFPRFSFKRSGADVSASVVVLERRHAQITDLSAVTDHPIYFGLVDKIGWNLQSKQPQPMYKRNPQDGSYILGADGSYVRDTSFEEITQELRSSKVAEAFPWIGAERNTVAKSDDSCIQLSHILERADLCLDPKRWCRKHREVVQAVRARPQHFVLGEVIRPISRAFSKQADARYRFVEIESIVESLGTYLDQECYGWELPQRCRLLAAPGDIFLARIWSSVGKWMIVGEDSKDGRLVVTSGCAQFELIPDKQEMLLDLVFGLSTEAYKVQMRARSTGSDGLSSVSTDDITSIVLPRIDRARSREALKPWLDKAMRGGLALAPLTRAELARTAPHLDIPPRSSHTGQV